MDTTIIFSGADALLMITEDIDMRIDSADPRAEYVYQLVIDDRPVLGYHRQPGEPWRDHGHDYSYPRHHPRYVFPATRTLAEVLEEARRLVYGAEPAASTRRRKRVRRTRRFPAEHCAGPARVPLIRGVD